MDLQPLFWAEPRYYVPWKLPNGVPSAVGAEVRTKSCPETYVVGRRSTGGLTLPPSDQTFRTLRCVIHANHVNVYVTFLVKPAPRGTQGARPLPNRGRQPAALERLTERGRATQVPPLPSTFKRCDLQPDSPTSVAPVALKLQELKWDPPRSRQRFYR